MDADAPLNSPSSTPLSRFGIVAKSRALRWRGHSGLAAGHRWRKPRSASEVKPTFTKSFASFKGVVCRVFIPSPSASRPGLLPLYLDVHGGGFMMGSPEMDDWFCAALSEKGICVVAVDYRKAPRWKFPASFNDVAGIADEVINAEGLPIDRNRVVIGGFSTGATLALTAVRSSLLQGRVHGVVAVSPLTDFAVPSTEKLASSPQSSGSGTDRMGKDFADVIQRAYVPGGTDLRDPSLSPVYASRGTFPRFVYIVGAECDMFCAEAERLAVSLAAQDDGGGDSGDGQQLENLDDSSWSKGTIRWECMQGWRHNFTHIAEKGDREKERLSAVEGLIDRIASWLWEGPYV